MIKQCTCDGRNENCFRCLGAGYYDDEDVAGACRVRWETIPKKVIKHSNRQNNIESNAKSVKSKAKPSKAVVGGDNRLRAGLKQCDVCLQYFPESEFEQHKQICMLKNIQESMMRLDRNDGVFNAQKGTVSHQIRREDEYGVIESVRCPYCNINIELQRFKDHFVKIHAKNHKRVKISKVVHALKGANNSDNSSASLNADEKYLFSRLKVVRHPAKKCVKKDSCKHPNPNSDIAYRCDKCRKVMPWNEYIEHIKVCDFDVQNVVKEKEKRVSKKEKHVVESKRVHPMDIDGSADYIAIRENGRFGSHPSFDDMGEESAP